MGGRIARLYCYNLNGFLFGVGLFPAAGSAARAAGPIPLQASCQPLVFPGEGQKLALWIWKTAAAGDLFQPGGQVPVVCAGREVPLRVAPSQAALGIVGRLAHGVRAAGHTTLDSAYLLNTRLPSRGRMHLDLTEEESSALLNLLRKTIDNDRYPLSPRVRLLRGIMAKFP